jgi:hypothetical protein
MKKKLVWTEVLNDQMRWTCRADFQVWFNDLVGRPTNLLDGTVEGFYEALGFMRRSLANLHFGEPVDLMWLDTQLKTITLGLLHHQGAQEGDASQMPRFRARVKGMIDSDLLRAVKDSLLIQFAEYLGDTLDETATYHVGRCEGLHRHLTPPTVPKEAAYTEEMEQAFRNEVPLLARQTPATSDLYRCINMFSGPAKSRYCSDSCRFATSQTAKQTEEVGDLSVKQRRFRRRQSQKQAE